MVNKELTTLFYSEGVPKATYKHGSKINVYAQISVHIVPATCKYGFENPIHIYCTTFVVNFCSRGHTNILQQIHHGSTLPNLFPLVSLLFWSYTIPHYTVPDYQSFYFSPIILQCFFELFVKKIVGKHLAVHFTPKLSSKKWGSKVNKKNKKKLCIGELQIQCNYTVSMDASDAGFDKFTSLS